MSDKKNGKLDITKASDTAKNIWLAGLGAYGKAIDQAHGRYERVSETSAKLFDELVAKGKLLEGDTHERLEDVKQKSTSTVEERIAKVKSMMPLVDFTSKDSKKIQELSKKVDTLTHKIDALLKEHAAESKPKVVKKPKVKSEAEEVA